MSAYGIIRCVIASEGLYRESLFQFVAAYVIPEDVWYLIPAVVLLRGKQKKALTLLPVKPRHPERYKYEGYREAWGLMGGGIIMMRKYCVAKARHFARLPRLPSATFRPGSHRSQRTLVRNDNRTDHRAKIKIPALVLHRTEGLGRGTRQMG